MGAGRGLPVTEANFLTHDLRDGVRCKYVSQKVYEYANGLYAH